MSQPDNPPKKSFLQEFREFSIKGNVIDLTVGVIIGAAFTKIVNSIVEDLVMGPLGAILGKVNYAELFLVIPGQDQTIIQARQAGKSLNSLADYKAAGVGTFAYGNFINNVIQFLIVAFAVFMMVRGINRLREKFGEKPAEPVKKHPCPYCLTEVPEEATRCAFCTSQLA